MNGLCYQHALKSVHWGSVADKLTWNYSLKEEHLKMTAALYHNLQIIFYLNGVYYIFYFLATLLMIIYKSQLFTYPDNFLALDLILLLVMAILEALRLYFGTKGNLTEEEAPLGISLVITAGSIILAVYFLVWQTYVMRADVIINAVLFVTYGLEGILEIIAIAAFVS
ncbi:transmembrane protein 80 isoform X2 [Hemicordylus capensis]|uniref:transmembrane protein 80 isoform X2 n=1 Tax=Hemicordylus capensis TaxID=884348 RepID=UPI0023044EAF|nr:transmembrane protein 80 isoform X2 [Hemicordylus capensis]